MKNCYKCLLSIILLLVCVVPLLAQSPIYLGKFSDIAYSYKQKANARKTNALGNENRITHAIPGKSPLSLNIHSIRQAGTNHIYLGTIDNVKKGSFYLRVSANTLSGHIILEEQKRAYKYSSTEDGVYLEPADIDKVLCIDYSNDRQKSISTSTQLSSISASTTMAAVPDLQSLPGASAVVLLDFNGHIVTNTLWNINTNGEPIVCAPSTVSSEIMLATWKVMKEDFLPFDINITTNEAVYLNAPANRRMRVVFTPTSESFGFIPCGAAAVGSFTWGDDTPCFVFNEGAKIGEAGSHEIGHTLGLSHDGLIPDGGYYTGQGSWAPIMGAGDSKFQVQWSKGEYPNANNLEDDLQIITTQNGFGYRTTDDHSNTSNGATPLIKDNTGKVASSSNRGAITSQSDIDVFSFQTTGEYVSLTISGYGGNLSVAAFIKNSSGATVAVGETCGNSACLQQFLPAGAYFLYVDNTKGELGADSDYGSFGEFDIMGSITPNNISPTITLNSPASNENFIAPGSISLRATPLDVDGRIAKVEFYNGLTKLAEDLTSPYTFTWSNVGVGTYSLTAKAIDKLGATGTSSVVTVSVISATAGCSASGTITRELWNNISGTAVSAIPVSLAPHSSTTLSSFETPTNAADNYGQRIRGYLCVPTTSSYTFYLAADDNAELYLSTDADPLKKTRIAYVSRWTNSREWGKYQTQKSTSVSLQTGVKYYIEALHKEGAGGDNLAVGWQTSASSPITVIPGSNLSPFVKSTPNIPIVSINSPLTDAIFSAPANITITATASDADGTVTKVEFFNGPFKIGEDLTAPFSYSWTNVAQGTYILTAKATDNLGLSTTSVAVLIKVNTTPTVSITSPASGASFTTPANINITATATDDGSVAKVEFFNGTTKLGEDLTAPYSYNWTNVAQGTYSLIAKATDNLGLSASTLPIPLLVNASTGYCTPFNIYGCSNIYYINNFSFHTLVNNSSLCGSATAPGYTNHAPSGSITTSVRRGQSCNLTVQSGADYPQSFGVWIDYNNDKDFDDTGEFVYASPVASTDLFSATITIPTTATLGATRMRVRSNFETISSTQSCNGFNYGEAEDYTINIISPPTITITSPTNNAVFTAPASITITANASDADGTVSKVEFYNGSTKLGEDLTAPYSYSWSNVAQGNYQLIVKATDNLGLSATSLPSYILVNASTGYCTPFNIYGCSDDYINNFSFHTLVNNSSLCGSATAPGYTNYVPLGSFTTSVNRGQSYNLSMESSMASAQGFGVWIDYNNDKDFDDTGEFVYASPIASTDPFSATITIPTTATLGATRMRVRSNFETLSSTQSCALSYGEAEDYTITIVGGNTPPTVNITSPTNNAVFTAPASITITANASDADGTVSKVEFYNGAIKLGEDLTAPHSFTWSNVAQGNYSLTAKATDNTNLSTTSSIVNVAVSGPSVACSGTGSISREVWTNIIGKTVSTIPVNTAPTSTSSLTSFQAPTNIANNYGQRIRGYVCVGTTGSYTFYIASDDNSELYLSPDADPLKKTRIAYVSGWTNPREWGKSMTQKSASVNLVAGVKYYIEALHKEDIYGEHLAVGWQSSPSDVINVIPGSNLSPYISNTFNARVGGEQIETLVASLEVYPNPSNGESVKIVLESLSANQQIGLVIYNSVGKVIAKHVERANQKGGIEKNLNFESKLSAGIYTIAAYSNNLYLFKKLIISR